MALLFGVFVRNQTGQFTVNDYMCQIGGINFPPPLESNESVGKIFR